MSPRFCLCVAVVFCHALECDAQEPPARAARPENLVTNPSFEDPIGGGGYPQGWGSFYPNPAGSYHWSIAGGGRTGQKAMILEGDGAFGAMPANRVPLDRTKRYVVRGWVKVEGPPEATADIKFHYYTAAGQYLDQTRVGYASRGDKWQFITVTDRAANFPQAGQIGLAISVTGNVKATYDDLELIAFDKDQLPPQFELEYGITRSPELALLGRRIGDWTVETTIMPCVWVPGGSKSKGVKRKFWALGGQFLEGVSFNHTTDVEGLSMMTYDRIKKVYRMWHFDSQGQFPSGEMTGTWDEATQSIDWQSTDSDGVTAKVRMTYASRDSAQWSGKWTDKDGRVVLDMDVALTRKSE